MNPAREGSRETGRHIVDEDTGDEAAEKIERSRSELEYILTERPLDPAFPRSRTMKLLSGHGPLIFAGLALGLMAVRPRWGARVMRLLPMVRMMKRMYR
jgi:hypothetical protein